MNENTLNVQLKDCECLTVTLNSEISSNPHEESDCNCCRHSVDSAVGLGVVLRLLTRGMYVVTVGDVGYFVHKLAGNYYKMYQTI